MVVRESMSLDLLDRLISDICATMESVMEISSEVDLAGWQPFSTSAEKKHGSQGHDSKHKHHAKRPMSEGVHRSVC